MKIKTITCHDVYNYGASLQAFALQDYLEILGNEVEIIDFKPLHHQNRYNFWHVPQNSKYYRITNKSKILKFLYCLKQYKNKLATIGRKKPFDNFKKDYLKITNQTFFSSDELKKTPPESDVYIAGSDQIWNTEAYNGLEPAYYLDFGDDKIMRISYAASFAIEDIKEDLHYFVKEKLSKFDIISVREKTGLSILEKIGISNGVQVLDPVFLLDRIQWESKFSLTRKVKKPYVLVYDFLHDDDKLTGTVKKIAEKKKLEIVSINDFQKLSYADINISNAGPIEFLSLIKYADYIISNSFHATAFAIIFERPFITFPLRSQNNASRMIDFLESLDLLDFFDSSIHNNKEIDYNNVKLLLKSYVEKSQKFLNTSLIKK